MKRLIFSFIIAVVLLGTGCSNNSIDVNVDDAEKLSENLKNSVLNVGVPDRFKFEFKSNNDKSYVVVKGTQEKQRKLKTYGYLEGSVPDCSKLYVKMNTSWISAFDNFPDDGALDINYEITSENNETGVLFCEIYVNGKCIRRCEPISMIDGKGFSSAVHNRIYTEKQENTDDIKVLPVLFVKAEKIDDNDFAYEGRIGDKTYSNSPYRNDYKSVFIQREGLGLEILNSKKENVKWADGGEILRLCNIVENGAIKASVDWQSFNYGTEEFTYCNDYALKENDIYYVPINECLQEKNVANFEIAGRNLGEEIRKLSVGDHIKLGKYEQDNDISNGREEIEWVVLERQNDRMLLLSLRGLECRAFDKKGDHEWSTSSLREWLTEEFVDNSFSITEKSYLLKTAISEDKNSRAKLKNKLSTQDYVFLLSPQEVEKYSVLKENLICMATDYAIVKYDSSSSKFRSWWLRTSSKGDNTRACTVRTNGTIDYYGREKEQKSIAVRPVIAIDIVKK